MCDYVDYPKKYGHGFAVLCSIFAVSHILADSCDFFTHILLWYFAGGVGYALDNFPDNGYRHHNIVINVNLAWLSQTIEVNFVANRHKSNSLQLMIKVQISFIFDKLPKFLQPHNFLHCY